MPKVETFKVVEKGNFDLYIQKRVNDILIGDIVHVQGLISVDLTLSQEVTNVAADDNPTYVSTTPPVTGDGTITILSMSYSDYEKIWSVYKDDNGALWFGGNTMADKVGLAYKTTTTDALGVESNNMISFPNMTISLPPKVSSTIDEDGGEISNVEMPVTINPVFWEDSLGQRKRATFGIINSIDNADIWADLKDTIFTPEMIIPA